ncbi:hypothetical protein [Trichlorobacter lovleyi]|uniref:hypothetical protein n=1 Tax=Trichlorobacter lovleyi TaxID=313985 RepID=UPI003D10554C
MDTQMTTIAAKELRDMKRAFLMLRGLFDTSKEYAERLPPCDSQQAEVLINNLTLGQIKAQEFFSRAKELEKGQA